MKAGWQVKELGEVVRLEYGKPLPDDQRNAKGRFSVYGANGEKSRSDLFLAKGPSLIIGRKGSAGEINLANEDFWPLDVTYFTQHDTKQIELGFLHFALSMLDLPSMARGVKPGINRNDVYELTISLPPLAEQKQIVAVLDAAFAGLSRARAHVLANLENLSHLRQSTLSRAFSGQLSTPHGTAPKTGWQIKALGEVCTKIGSGATPRGGNESYKNQGIALIRSLNVHDLEFRLKDLAFLDDDQAAALDNVSVNAGDVLLNITGASVARCCIAPAELLPARVNQHVSILRPKPEQLNTDFLAYLLVAKEMKDRLLGIGEEGGSTRQALTKAQLQDFKIPLPPITEQREIVTTLDAAFDAFATTETQYRAKLADLDALRAALLQKAFEGELT